MFSHQAIHFFVLEGKKSWQPCWCRFAGRNYGYAKYVSHDAAQRALDALHEAEMCGNVLKVKVAPASTLRCSEGIVSKCLQIPSRGPSFVRRTVAVVVYKRVETRTV